MRLIGLALLAAVPLAVAQNTTSTDMDFYKEAAQANIAEVELGRLASQKATSPEVKAFAQQMVTDHTRATTELQQIAQRKGVTLPTEPDMRHKASRKALEALSGSAFDKAYVESQEMDHDRTVAMLEKQVTSGKDADAKALASQLLPIVQQHRKMVDQLEEGGSASHGAAAAHSGGDASNSGDQTGSGTRPRSGMGTGSGTGSSTGNSSGGTGSR